MQSSQTTVHPTATLLNSTFSTHFKGFNSKQFPLLKCPWMCECWYNWMKTGRCNIPSRLNTILIGHSLHSFNVSLPMLMWPCLFVFNYWQQPKHQTSYFDTMWVLHIILNGFSRMKLYIRDILNAIFQCVEGHCRIFTFLSFSFFEEQVGNILVSVIHYLFNNRPPNDTHRWEKGLWKCKSTLNTAFQAACCRMNFCHFKDSLKCHVCKCFSVCGSLCCER